MAQALERSDREVGRRHLEREALTDEPGKLLLALERVEARHDAARAVAEQEHGQARLARGRERDDGLDVADVVGEVLDVEPLAVRLAAPAEIAGIDRQTVRRELLRRPAVVPAVGIESVD